MTILLLILLIILFRLAPQLISSDILQTDDFVEYWAAGKLNLTGGNPYGPSELLPLQLQIGRQYGVPVMMWNPPWTLALVMPFAYLDYPLARFIWFLSHTAILVFCARYLWRYCGGSHDKAWVAILITFTFLPSLFALKTGQISALLLLGLVFFLMWLERRTWWLLSLSLLLMAVKPHILYLPIVAFLWWSLRNDHWTLLLISGMGILLATGIAFIINPQVLVQYFYAIRNYPPDHFATPTLGGALRFVLGVDHIWLQFLPSFLGLLWFFLYWRKEGPTCRWSQQLPILTIISALTASYAWSCDYLVFLLPILSVATAIFRQGLNWVSISLIILYFAIDLQVFRQVQQGNSNDFWFLWLAPALSGWYFLAMRSGLAPGFDPQGANLQLENNFPHLTFPPRASG